MNAKAWLLQRATDLREQLRQEAVQAGVINTTEAISCELKVVLTAATQEKIETLKTKFGYKNVTVYPEGLSVATIEVDSGPAGKHDWFYHILSDGTRAYPQQYLYAGPFVRGYAVVGSPGGYCQPPMHHHIHPDGKPVYDPTLHWFSKAWPFSEEGIAKVELYRRAGGEMGRIDLKGNLLE